MGGGVTATEGILGGRQATTFLTRASWSAGGAFMVLSLILAILSSRAQAPSSILQQDLQPSAAPTPLLPEADAPAPTPVVPDAGPTGDTGPAEPAPDP